ncbi:MAG: tetratricopeptide repeat protein [Pseudomonadota bacterium]
MSGDTTKSGVTGAETGGSLGLPDIGLLLQQISTQMSAAEEKNTAALEKIQGQLELLSAETRRARRNVPAEFAPAFDRLEEAIDALAEKVARAEQSSRLRAQDTAVPASTGDAEAEGDAVDAASEPDFAPVSDITFQEPPAVTMPASLRGASDVAPPAAAPKMADPDPADTLEAEASGDPDDPWDSQSAEALTRIYETDPEALAPGLEPGPSVAEAAPEAPAAEETEAKPVSRTQTVVQVLPQPNVVKEEWLEERFAKIAGNVAQTFRSSEAEVSFGDLAKRLEELESRLDQALNDVATRSDVEGIRVIENYLNDLSDQFERSQSELSRVGMIEREVMTLAERLSDDRLNTFVAPAVQQPPNIDFDAVAEQVAARVVAQTPVPAPAVAEPSPVTPEALEAVAEVHRMVADLTEQNRSGGAETTSMIKTMEQAMIRLLDRMDGIEHAQLALVEQVQSQVDAPQSSAASAPAPEPQPAPKSDMRRSAEPVPAPVPVPAPPEAAPADEPADDAPTYAPVQRAQVNKPTRTSTDNIPRVSNRAVGNRDLMPDPTPTDDQVEAARTKREEFVAAARRAALRANERAGGVEEADVSFEAVEADSPEEAAPRRRIDLTSLGLGRDRNEAREPEVDTDEEPPKQGSSRMRLWVAGLALAVMALGAGKVAVDQMGVSMPDVAQQFWSTDADDTSRQASGASVPVISESGEPAVQPSSASASGEESRIQNSDAAADETVTGGRAVASADRFPLGISLDANGAPITPETAQILSERQQRAQASTQVGATLPTASAVPASLIPVDPDAQGAGANTLGRATSSAKQQALMPPPLLGPLSLRTAAANGKPSAQFEIGARYAEGRGVDQDFKQAAVWYGRAANQNFPLAQYRLATLHERGLGVAKDLSLAKYWYLKAANQGTVKAMHNLAVLTAGQVGGTPDYKSAAIWFQKAAGLGLADSQFNLAILYQNGLGVGKDLAKAYKWFGLASLAGDAEAKSQQKALADQIARADRLRIDSLVKTWRAKPFAASANDASVAGQLWQKADS